MNDKPEGGLMQVPEGYESDFTLGANLKAVSSPGDLGDPMKIEEVAELLGCSPWTVRQRYLRQGLPHLQASARGKLVFFREQIIAWVEKRQQQRQKGGQLR
jgi:hypothetical protein